MKTFSGARANSRPGRGLMARGLLVGLTGLVLGGSTPPPGPGVRTGAPRLCWISVASRQASQEVGVSVLFEAGADTGWVLEARATGPECRDAGAPGFRQRIADRELSYFPLAATESDTLVIRLHRVGAEPVGSIHIPLASVRERTLLVPEWSPGDGPIHVEDWTLLPIQLAEAAAVCFAVYDGDGRPIRSWPGTYLTAGPMTVLWDQRDQSGNPVAAGTYHLVLTGRTALGG